MSYSNSFPTQRPTLNLDFANSGKLDSRISYARSSTGTALSSERHLSSENLISQSADLGSWSEASSAFTTITSNATAAPDGTTTAAQITGLTGTNKKGIYYPISASTGSNTGIFYVKPNGHEYVQIMFGGATTIYQNFHLSGSGTLGNGTNDAASIDKMGDWYRITITSSSLSIATNYYLVMVDSNTAARYEDSTSTSSIFAWGANFSSTNQKVFNSTTTQIHREYAPTLKTYAANEPRFEYTADGESEGLLIEAQATNKATYSEDFTNAVYNKYRATIEPASAIAPDGTLTASFLREDATASNTHYFNTVTNTGLSVGTTKYAVSIFVKAAGRSRINMYDNNQSAPGTTTFDLSSGTVVTGDGSIQNCGNGWFRCTIIPTCDYSATSAVYILLDNGSGTSYTGNSYSGILVWGYQLETGVSASSSYIKSNSGSSTTRSADSCSVDLDGILADGQDVTLYAEGDFGDPAVKASNRIAVILQQDSGNYINLYNGSGYSGTGYINYGGVSQADWSGVTTGEFKAAVSAKPNSFNYAANGIAGAEDTSGTVPNYNSLHLGEWYAGTLQLDGTLKRVTLYGQALSSTELAALTS